MPNQVLAVDGGVPSPVRIAGTRPATTEARLRRFKSERPFELDRFGLSGVWSWTNMTIELDREEDGRWLTEIPELPGVMAYGSSQEEALAKVKALALRVMADRLEHGEAIPELVDVFSVAA